MKTYFDYEEIERSNLTEEEVKKLLDAELMVKGVLKVEPPVLKDVPILPEMKQERWYQVGSVLFDSTDKADKFIALKPMKEDYNWDMGSKNKYVKPYSDYDHIQKIIPVDVYSEADIVANSALLKQIRAVQDYNEKAQTKFREESAAMEKVLRGVWDDYFDIQEKKRKLEGFAKTFDSYVKTANGDTKTAAQFIIKVISQEDLKEASEWLNRPEIFEAIRTKDVAAIAG